MKSTERCWKYIKNELVYRLGCKIYVGFKESISWGFIWKWRVSLTYRNFDFFNHIFNFFNWNLKFTKKDIFINSWRNKGTIPRSIFIFVLWIDYIQKKIKKMNSVVPQNDVLIYFKYSQMFISKKFLISFSYTDLIIYFFVRRHSPEDFFLLFEISY